MKKYSIVILITYLLSLISCSNNNSQKPKDDSVEKNKFPQYILIVYMGEINHPVSPFLIMTDILDTTYLKYMGESKENLEDHGFIIPKTVKERYLKRAIIDNNTFNIIRRYIEKNNTGINQNIWNSDNSTSKIIIEYNHKSIIYTVDKSTPDYYLKLMKEIKSLNNKDLYNGLKYINKICQRAKNE